MSLLQYVRPLVPQQRHCITCFEPLRQYSLYQTLLCRRETSAFPYVALNGLTFARESLEDGGIVFGDGWDGDDAAGVR